MVDCKSGSLTVTGPGLVYEEVHLSIAETREYISEELAEARFRKMCAKPSSR